MAEEREIGGKLSLRCLYHPNGDISTQGSRAQTERLARRHSLGVPSIQGHPWPWERMGLGEKRALGERGRSPLPGQGEEAESGRTQKEQPEGARRKTRDMIGKSRRSVREECAASRVSCC